jgi:hypothetical protein
MGWTVGSQRKTFFIRNADVHNPREIGMRSTAQDEESIVCQVFEIQEAVGKKYIHG